MFFYNNKAVVGSGSEGTPKYVGEGITYGAFLGYYSHFLHVCATSGHTHSWSQCLDAMSHGNVT